MKRQGFINTHLSKNNPSADYAQRLGGNKYNWKI
jgi:hypothetical protein